MDTARLREHFETRVRQQIQQYTEVLQYPRRFAEAVQRDGATVTSDNLFQEGMDAGRPRHPAFERAWEAERLDLTVEWLVWAEPRWQPLFGATKLRYLKLLAEDLAFQHRRRTS